MEDQFIDKARRGFYLTWPLLAVMLVSFLALAASLSLIQAAALIIPTSVLLTIMTQSARFLCSVAPLQVYRLGKPVISQMAAALVVSGLWVSAVLATGALLSIIPSWENLGQQIQSQLPMLFGVGAMYYLLAAAFYYVISSLQATHEARQQENDARLQARDSELKALKSQINPHFLFNSLHSISALTTADAAKARQMCILLSDFLRSTLGLGEKSRINLSDELKLIKQYLSIEQVRFGSIMQIEEKIEPGTLDCLVPPLLLQPLVENAVKHGIATMTQTGLIRLETGLSKGRLRISIGNQYDSEVVPKHSSGMGLRNVKQRLLTAYDGEVGMSANSDDGYWQVELHLPAQTGEPS